MKKGKFRRPAESLNFSEGIRRPDGCPICLWTEGIFEKATADVIRGIKFYACAHHWDLWSRAAMQRMNDLVAEQIMSAAKDEARQAKIKRSGLKVVQANKERTPGGFFNLKGQGSA